MHFFLASVCWLIFFILPDISCYSGVCWSMNSTQPSEAPLPISVVLDPVFLRRRGAVLFFFIFRLLLLTRDVNSDFKMQFTISLMPPLEGAAHGAEDQRLPTARACFFEFYLPRYTTIKVCCT